MLINWLGNHRLPETLDFVRHGVVGVVREKTCSHSGPIALARGFAVPRHDAISNPAAAREPLVKRCAERPKKTPNGAHL